MKKRILIFYTSHSLGHKVIGENIGWHLQQAGYDVKLVDALKGKDKGAVGSYLKLHILVNKYIPWFWRFLYMWGYLPTMPFRTLVAGFNVKLLEQEIREFNPDMVITTQTAPSAALSYLKKRGRYNGLFGIAFSDFHFHPYWMYPGADFYLANIPEQATELTKRGVPSGHIFVCGITAKPILSIDTTSVRRRLGIPEQAKVALLAAGSLGIGLPLDLLRSLEEQAAEQLSKHGREVHIVVVCGKNQELYRQLAEVFTASNMHVLGFYSPMEELYALADIFISKPGGLSTIEALRHKLPIMVTHILPGQEELNLNYLTERQLVLPLYVKPKQQWLQYIVEELTEGKFRESLINNPYCLQLIQASSGASVVAAVGGMFHAKAARK